MCGNASITKESISTAGEKYVSMIFHGVKGEDLNIISTKYVTLPNMPPTSRVCFFHSMRVHHEMSAKRNMQTVLDKDIFGFKGINNPVVPVVTDKPVAPEELLREVRCSCKVGSCTSCSLSEDECSAALTVNALQTFKIHSSFQC